MKLGMFMMPLHPPAKDRTACFEEDIEQVVRAEALGFTEAWIGQHHSVAWEPIPSNDLFIANLLPRTSTIRLGTGVSIIPHHHPVNIAARLAFLDHLARGRINVGFGQSGVPTDWELFDLPDPGTQGLMTLEGMDLVMKLWQSEAPFDFRGRFWHVRADEPDPELGVGVMLKPYQKPHPPIAMSVIKAGSRAARTAGERGFIPISTNLVPDSTLASHWDTYCAGAAAAGRPEPDRARWRVARSIFVADRRRGGVGSCARRFLRRVVGLSDQDPDRRRRAAGNEGAARSTGCRDHRGIRAQQAVRHRQCGHLHRAPARAPGGDRRIRHVADDRP